MRLFFIKNRLKFALEKIRPRRHILPCFPICSCVVQTFRLGIITLRGKLIETS